MPGGALTANTQMMRDNNMMDRYPKVIAKMGEVVRRGGFGTSVTPVSQFYFQQAFNNEIFGDWKRIADGYGKMVLGYFGKTPVPPDPEIVALAAEQLELEPTTRNPREINDEDPNKGLHVAKARLEAEGLEVNDENMFVVSTCLDKGVAFLKGQGELGVRKIQPENTAANAASDNVTVTLNGKSYNVSFDGGKATVNGKSYAFTVGEGDAPAAAAGGGGAGQAVKSELAAKIFKVETSVGASVKEGDLLLVLEALKMEIEVNAPADGVVQELPFTVGQAVAVGDTIAVIG